MAAASTNEGETNYFSVVDLVDPTYNSMLCRDFF